MAQWREAMRKTFRDPAFLKEFKRLSADDATPLLPEAQEKAIKEIPRDADVIALFNKIAGNDPLPQRRREFADHATSTASPKGQPAARL